MAVQLEIERWGRARRSRRLRRGVGTWLFVALVAGGSVVAGEPPTDPTDPASEGTPGTPATDRSPTTDGPESLDALRAALRASYPGRDAVHVAWEEISGRLIEYADRQPPAPDAGEARSLAAEVLLLADTAASRSAARKQWAAMAASGPDDETRARGLYLLGEYYVLLSFRAAPLDTRRLQYLETAGRYLPKLVERYPESAWSPVARQMDAYRRLAFATEAPSFEVTCRRPDGGELSIRGSHLRGKVVLLDFWRAEGTDANVFEQAFPEKLGKYLKKYPVLEERVFVLGVCLDRDEEVFRAAVEGWNLPWWQVHDGRAFEGEMATRFAAVRAPHFVVIDAHGGLRYLGPSSAVFLDRAETALTELRISVEEFGDDPAVEGPAGEEPAGDPGGGEPGGGEPGGGEPGGGEPGGGEDGSGGASAGEEPARG